MIEVLSLLAAILGVTVQDLTAKVKKYRQQWSDKRILEREAAARAFASPNALAQAVAAYYSGSRGEGPLRRYCLNVGEQEVPTSVYCQPEWLRQCSDLSAVSVSLRSHPISPPPIATSRRLLAYGAERLARMQVLGAVLYDDPLYALSSIDPSTGALTFSEASFLQARFGAALVGDELSDALTAKQGDLAEVVREADSLLPLRKAFYPSLAELANYGSRITGGGIGVVVALAVPNGFRIPIQVRSDKVADGARLRAVVPKAYHQAGVGQEIEVYPYWTALRELFEECFNNDEAARDSRHLLHDWYLNENEAVAHVHKNRGQGVQTWFHGVALNGVNGNYELAITIVIEDESFLPNFGNKFMHNWEIKNWDLLETRDQNAISRALTDPTLVNESRFHLAESLLALRARFPERVAEPLINRFFQ